MKPCVTPPIAENVLKALTLASAPAPTVALIGAGPGDPELLTIKAGRLLASAEVVLFDNLVSEQILALCPEDARMIDVGKIPGGKATAQQVINALLIKEARQGARVVRLKGGDPFVFGRGGEEAIALAEHGIACEIVPGISSCIAAPAAANIPVTHRHVSTHFTVVTGMSARAEQDNLEESWEKIAAAGGTIVFLMGVRKLDRIVARVLAAGRAATTPAAMVRAGTREEQEVVTGTLADIVGKVRDANLKSPAVFVVGEVVALRDQLTVLTQVAEQQRVDASSAPAPALAARA